MAQKSKSSSQRLIPEEQHWFNKLPSIRKDFLCVGVLFLLVYILFWDIIVKDMIFSDSGDTAAHQSWAKAIEYLEQSEHLRPLWIPYIFGGMPIASALLFPQEVNYAELLIQIPGKLLFLNAQFAWLVLHYFLMGAFMFLFARQLNFSHLPSLIAAVTVMLNPYAIGLAQVGHGSKLVTLSYIPLLLLTTHRLFQRRDILSFALQSAVIGTMVLSNHPQIAYYGLLVISCYLLYEILLDVKQFPVAAAKKTLLFGLALALGFAIFAYNYLPTQEYAQYSIRGGGEAGAAGGLNYDYATNWSFHPLETVNYLIPSFFGFSTPYYWGWMPFTDATVYVGVVPLLLGILALLYKRSRETIFFFLLSILMLFISFGKHLPIVYDLLFNYFPYFNKFRVPVMILHLMPITFGILSAYGWRALSDFAEKSKEAEAAKLKKRLSIAAGVIGALLVVGFLFNSALYGAMSDFMFEKEGDLQQLRQQYGAQASQVLGQLKRTRFDLLWKDTIKFAVIAGISLGIVIMYLKRRMMQTTLGLGLLTVLIIDLLIIDTKYIDPKPLTTIERTFAPNAAIQFLKSDTTLYRIFPLDQTGEWFRDNTYMYHTIQSIGGYSPAKLKIYQEMIDSCLYRGWDRNFPLNMNIVDMLNVKYVLAPGRLPEDRFMGVHYDQTKNIATHLNRSFMPRAWFVENVLLAGSKREVFQYLNASTFNPRTSAILEKQPLTQPGRSDSTSLHLTSYGTHTVVLKTYCSNQSLLVLSEIFYPAGWKATIDGSETEIYKTNYILRSVVVPEGTHTVEFVFNPEFYTTGLTITHAAWGMTALLILGGIIQHPKIRAKLHVRKTKIFPLS